MFTAFLCVVLGFVLGALWQKSGEQQIIDRNDYNRAVSAALVWFVFAYQYVKNLLLSLRPEGVDEFSLEEKGSDNFGDIRINLADRSE